MMLFQKFKEGGQWMFQNFRMGVPALCFIAFLLSFLEGVRFLYHFPYPPPPLCAFMNIIIIRKVMLQIEKITKTKVIS